MAVNLEPGIFHKQSLYNWLLAEGYFLPQFNSNCVTIESLNNFRSNRYHLYLCEQLSTEIQTNDVLLANVRVVYKFLQSYHYTKFGKPLPFRKTPSEEYIRVIIRHVDPDNDLNFLKTEWGNVYDYDLLISDGQMIRQERPQGQAIQREIDKQINNATRLYHSKMAYSIRQSELSAELEAIKASFTSTEISLLTSEEKFLFESPSVTDIVEKMVNDILDENIIVDNSIPILEDQTLITKSVEESDAGEVLEDSGTSNEEALQEGIEELRRQSEQQTRGASLPPADKGLKRKKTRSSTGRAQISTAFRSNQLRTFSEDAQSNASGPLPLPSSQRNLPDEQT